MRRVLTHLEAAKHSLMQRPAFATQLKTGLTKLLVLCLGAVVLCGMVSAQTYQVTNIVSDGSVPATNMDAAFINPWAISASPTWWISTEGSGFNYVVQTAGTIPFKVVVPAASTGAGQPTGDVTTAGTTGMVLPNGTKASFLFSTLDGTISGWNSALGEGGAVAQIAINNNAAGASYPGLAVINTATASYILAPNFGTGNAIEVYNGSFARTTLPGSFTDPNLPAGYSPFSVHVIGTQVFVAYALRSAAAPYTSVNALGNGVVSVFDTSGNFVARVATGGNLDSPWGVAIAPASFGIFSNDLLIGNFGNGLINVYNPTTYAYLGQLTGGTGAPLSYASLWELLPGGTTVGNTTTVSGGSTSTVYFTAGLAGEAHGLFGGISSNATATGSATFGFSAATGSLSVAPGSSVQTTLSVAPTNGFAGMVTLACSGLPSGATCAFSPAQFTATASAPATGTVTIMTTGTSTALRQPHLPGTRATGLTLALLVPFGSLLALYRRRRTFDKSYLRSLGLLIVLFGSLGILTSCSSTSSMGNMPSTPSTPSTPAAPTTPATPAGTSQVTVTATSGTTMQTAVIALTVQ
jgi:uncharacterized protein (TIGR03118 family)